MAEDGARQSSGLAKLWRDVRLEIYSWLRYLFAYLLPRGLSYPFQFKAVTTLYFIVLAALVLFYIPANVLSDFARAWLQGAFESLFGKPAAAALPSLLAAFKGAWVLPAVGLLLLWGLLVLVWARHEREFFASLKAAGVQIVRGPGERLAFLERLYNSGSTLGRGPTARILPTYVPRNEDPLLRQRVKAYQKQRENLGLLITSIATAGKTRSAMELIADVNPALVFLWPRDVRAGGITVTDWHGSAILFADDVTLPPVEGGVPLPAAMIPLLQDAPKIIMLGTIRRHLLPAETRGLEAIELTEMQPDELAQLAVDVAAAEQSLQASRDRAKGSEWKSWLRWLYSYFVPYWLPYPFTSGTVVTIYLLSLLTFGVIFTPTGALHYLAQAILQDGIEKLLGEHSVLEFRLALLSFRPAWAIALLSVLFFWGIAALLWAKPRRKFFDALKIANVEVVRGPGQRDAFMERLKDAMRRAGLVSGTKLLPVYVHKSGERSSFVDTKVYAQTSAQTLGAGVTSKAWVAMQLVYDACPALVFVWPLLSPSLPSQDFPAWHDQGIVFVELHAASFGTPGIAFPRLLEQLRLRCPRLEVIGTVHIRDSSESAQLQEELLDTRAGTQDYRLLGQYAVYVDAETDTKQRLTSQDVLQRYNGHPGSLVVGLASTRMIYERLSSDQHSALRAAKLLRTLGILDLTVERLHDATEIIASRPFDVASFHDMVDWIVKIGLISWGRGGQQTIQIYEGYLEHLIDLPEEFLALEPELSQRWVRREDGAAFVDRGTQLTDASSNEFQANPRAMLQAGIACYEQALQFLTATRSPLRYAEIQNKLGEAYRKLAGYGETTA